ncbi:ArgS-related anticodon-binding protein NrtL [Streptomyces sp. NPDC047014]|uniref:ArgS-related anticodon-binding protein NrtL n=1 Tax=Streptomyces sp. NPDC047014 TaxID=3155736 RepID=UPI00340D46C5
MTPADLSPCVVRAVRRAVADGELGAGTAVPERVVVERTRPGGVGEYASPVALSLARAAGRPPREVAGVLARRLGAEPGIERVDVTGAGFLNFVLPDPSAPGLVAGVMLRDRVVRALCVPGAGGPGTRRQDVVHAAVLRLLRLQGRGDRGLPAAPVAARDGDVLARFGSDAARWAMLAVPARETPVFSDVLLHQGEASEFFRVRYAHARARALVRNAAQLGFRPEPGPVDGADALLRALADHPLALEAAAHHRAPERLVRDLVGIADALLDFQYRVLPQGDEKPSAAHRARLALAEAAGTVLAGGLALLGMDAPERL